MKIDPDLKLLTAGQLSQELQRVRQALRRHRRATGNARCWHNDQQLYARTLPDAEPPGRMTQPVDELLRNCRAYIRRQQCGSDCSFRS